MSKALVLTVLFAMVMFQTAYTAELKTINSENEYGGETTQIQYGKEDQEFKLERRLEFYDSAGILRKVTGYRINNQHNDLKIAETTERYSETGKLQSVELIFQEEKTRETGYHKIVTFYNSERTVSRKEIYYNKSDFSDQIYSKSVDFFEVNGEKIRTEYFLSENESRRTGFYKLVSYYAKGKVIKQELQDKKGTTY